MRRIAHLFVFATAITMTAVGCASSSPGAGETTPEGADARICRDEPAVDPQHVDQRYAARVVAVVDRIVDCGGGDRRLVLTASSGDFHGSFVGHVVAMRSVDGGALDPGREADSRQAIERARAGDRVEVDMGMYPALHLDGTLANPGGMESFRLLGKGETAR